MFCPRSLALYPCVALLLWPLSLMAQTASDVGSDRESLFRQCDKSISPANVRAVVHLDRWSIGGLDSTGNRYVVIDRTPSAHVPCSTFSRVGSKSNPRSLRIYRSDACTGEFCPTLLATNSPKIDWGVFERSCNAGFSVRRLAVNTPTDVFHVRCKEEIGVGYRQIESIITLSGGVSEKVSVVAGEVEILTEHEIANVGCQPKPVGGIRLISSEVGPALVVTETTDRLNEGTVRTRSRTWIFKGTNLVDTASEVTEEQPICPRKEAK